MSHAKKTVEWIMWKARPKRHAYTREQIESNPGEWASATCLRCHGHDFRDYPPHCIPARCPDCGSYMADTAGDDTPPDE